MPYFVEIAIPPLDSLYSYGIPLTFPMVENLIGYGLPVEFGHQQRFGYIISESDSSDVPEDKLKFIHAHDGLYRCFLPEQLEFFRWIASYYALPLANVIETAVPKPVADKKVKYVRLLKEPDTPLRGTTQIAIIEELKASKEAVLYSELLSKYKKSAASTLNTLADKGLIEIFCETLKFEFTSTEDAPAWAKTAVTLNSAQESALQKIKAALNSFEPFLLHGVTGSGKTEVYIDAILHARERRLASLVIVPEIALTPQLVDRFKARLGNKIAVLHSAMSARERWSYWQAIINNEVDVVIGARSGIFAPIPNLGLIVVDEEHDGSYKQSDGLRYNARDLAVVLAKQRSCPVVLGSATPSLETYYNAIQKKFTYLPLPKRHDSGSSISINIVDMNKTHIQDLPSPNISNELYHALEATLERGEQAFIMYNRRGFASYLQCESCNTVLSCPHCSVTLTLHRTTNTLKCHYCGYEIRRPKYCPNCCEDDVTNSLTNSLSNTESCNDKGTLIERGSGTKKVADKEMPQSCTDKGTLIERGSGTEKVADKEMPQSCTDKGMLIERGSGTEKVYDELKVLFPDAKISRLDRDTADNPIEYREILDSVRSHKTDILVGTQMIAKGHDLPGVTLVGIVDCDVGLNLPDFRASERIFQLLTQASGRAGRGENTGHVILQTREPEHLSLRSTKDKSFKSFAEKELANRRDLSYPPFSRILRIVVSSANANDAFQAITILKKHISELIDTKKLEVSMLGPAPTPIAKIRDKWRFHLLLKSKNPNALVTIQTWTRSAKFTTKDLKITLDLDPQEML